MKMLFQKYKHAWVFLYGFIYMPWFLYLEKHVTRKYNIIHTAFDEMIPFIEYFIIPYLLWFLFIAATVLYFFFKDKKEFYRLVAFLITGMTIFLFFSTLYPNGQILRPTTFERNNIFVDMVKLLYKSDTPTNIFPSIHVYNSIGAYITIHRSELLREKRFVQTGSLILTVLIILSTLFLKQHSIIDVIGAVLLSMIVYRFAYATERKRSHALSRLPI